MNAPDVKTDLIAFMLDLQKFERDVIFEWAARRIDRVDFLTYMVQTQAMRARVQALIFRMGIP
ncbi:MAG: hypothetical protein MPL62_16375 [Alphaproteobacteria bacterium]|nr:hypothetical protein [Alphaproteobacteria bacterium]